MSGFLCDRFLDTVVWFAAICLIAIFCISNSVSASGAAKTAGRTYYVSSAGGDDSNDGLSAEHPWKTIAHINDAPIKPGDSILLKRGCTWHAQIIPHSGDQTAPVTYGAYGDGAKPRIYGSFDRSYRADWRQVDNHTWETRDIPCDVGNIVFDHEKAVGVKVWSLTDVNAPKKFWYDKDTSRVALYCEGNPAGQYQGIELALRRNIIEESDRHYVTYDNLDLRYGGAHGVGGTRTSHIIVRNCDFSYIGGGLLAYWDSKPVRFGNGVEFWEEAHDNLVEGCRFWEIYDTAVTNQGNSKNSQTNITYSHNLIWNCGMAAFECWNQPNDSTIENVYFENNTCVNSGYGWSHDQRPDKEGRHLLLFENQAKTKSVCIRNNIFYQIHRDDSEYCLCMINDWLANLTLDHNCWYQPSGAMIVLPSPLGWHTMAHFAEYQAKTGKDAHSIAADPRFTDVAKHDFRPAVDSPVCHLASDGSYAGALPPARR